MKEIPSLKQTKASIENFNNEVLLKVDDFESIEDYLAYFDSIFKKHFPIYHYIFQLQKPEFFMSTLFRVREFNPIKNKGLFSEYSYPPSAFVGNGRCNFKGFPVFYCSSNPITALLEVIRNTEYKSKKFCISVWSLLDNKQNFVLGSFLQSELHPSNPFKQLATSYIKNIDKAFENKLTQDQKLGVIEFYKFIDQKFIEDKDYSISAYLSHQELYAKHRFASDIIIYPSAQLESKSVNFAIQPNFVDNCMKVERFYLVELNEFDSLTDIANITFSSYGKIEKNFIHWKNLKPGDTFYERNFKKDFSSYLDNFREFNYQEHKNSQ